MNIPLKSYPVALGLQQKTRERCLYLQERNTKKDLLLTRGIACCQLGNTELVREFID